MDILAEVLDGLRLTARVREYRAEAMANRQVRFMLMEAL